VKQEGKPVGTPVDKSEIVIGLTFLSIVFALMGVFTYFQIRTSDVDVVAIIGLSIMGGFIPLSLCAS